MLKPDKCLVVVTQSKIGEYKCSRGNVFSLFTSFQFVQQSKCVRAPASLGLSVHKKANKRWAVVGNRDAFFQHWDRLLRLMVRDECKPQNPQSEGVIWFHCKRTMQLLYRLVITAGKKEMPGQVSTRNGKRIKFAGAAAHCQGFLGTSPTV